MASEPAEPTTRPQDDVIERARQLIDDEVMTRTGRSVGDLASGHVARALADAGLLADPAQTADRDRLSLLLRGMARKLVAYRKWALKAHRDQDWVLNRVRAALGTPDGRAVSVHAAEVRAELERTRRERDLAVAHDRQPYPTAWAYEQACRSIRAKQARIDAALALHVDAMQNGGRGLPQPILLALTGDQPTDTDREVPNA